VRLPSTHGLPVAEGLRIQRIWTEEGLADFERTLIEAYPVPGVEASTGSLGHGLAMSVGVALALRAKGLTEQRVVVLTGDAELNEGSNWEAILLAPNLHLDNLTLLVIDNHSSHLSMTPWDAKLEAFGWSTRIVDGHDRDALADALGRRDPDRPTAVVADIPEGEW